MTTLTEDIIQMIIIAPNKKTGGCGI